jgi:hypothetical protein
VTTEEWVDKLPSLIEEYEDENMANDDDWTILRAYEEITTSERWNIFW